MKSRIARAAALAAALTLAAAPVACERDETPEEIELDPDAPDTLDLDVPDDAAEQLEETGRAVGGAVGEAIEETGEAIESAGERIREEVEENRPALPDTI